MVSFRPEQVVCVIPARGGSKGILRKNVRRVGGHPLIAHTVRQACDTPGIGRVVVSTDDQEIADVSEQYGAEVVWRPASIAGDAASSESALVDTLDQLRDRDGQDPELVVFLQATSPFRRPDEIQRAIETLCDQQADSLFSAAIVHGFVWRLPRDGAAPQSLSYDYRDRRRRQDAPEDVVENGSIYVFKTSLLRETGNRLGGRIAVHRMHPLDSFQVDEPGDIELMNELFPVRGTDPAPASRASRSTPKGPNMPSVIPIGRRKVGAGQPTFIIGEIGINHNGDLDIAKRLIDAAVLAGCDAVKFQKRTPEVCVPVAQREVLRETPWGLITYMEYRERVEFGRDEYAAIDRYCRDKGIEWFVSPWDEPSVDFMEQFEPSCYKVASASLTDFGLLDRLNATGRPIILSSGMSTMEQIEAGVGRIDPERVLLAHSTSAYPCPTGQLNLRMIQTLKERFGCPIGYSGHETGLQTTCAAVTLGAQFVERHITLDRAMWGSDHAASVEPPGLMRLVRDIRVIEEALGDGVKQVYDTELPIMKKLRRVDSASDQKADNDTEAKKGAA